MKDFSLKFRLLFVPFLVVSVGYILLYTVLNWIIFIHFDLIPMNEMYTEIFLPMFLVVIPLYIYLRPRANLLNRGKKNADRPMGYLYIAWFSILVPTIISQLLLKTATGKLQHLESINEINEAGKAKYYKINKFYLDKDISAVKQYNWISGKYNNELNFGLYFATPLFNEKQVSDSGRIVHAWLATVYTKQMNNSASEIQKEESYTKFRNETISDFSQKDLTKFEYLERVGHNDDGNRCEEGIKKHKLFRKNLPIILLKPVQEEFENRNGSKLLWVFLSFGIGSLVVLLVQTLIPLDEEKLKSFYARRGREDAKQNLPSSEAESISSGGNEFIKLFIPRNDFFATPLIIDLNLAIFLAMVFTGLGFINFQNVDLYNWGADFRPAVIHGQWWRLLTSTFLHGGIMHLLNNMYALLMVGTILEPLIGKIRFGIAYFLNGLLASITSIFWHKATLGVGASGAIMGMYGAALALIVTKTLPEESRKPLLTFLLIFVGINIAIGFTGGVDNAAHIGGLAAGFLLGLILSPQVKEEIAERLEIEETTQ